MTNDQEHAHEIALDRANKDYAKRIRERQKRFGKPHDIDQDLIDRAEVATLNRSALIDLMGQHKILIPARELPVWRPTQPSKGDINGVQEAITIVATNGILGWFLTHDGTAWCGHIQCFDGDIKPLFSLGKPKTSKVKVKKPRKKTERQKLIDSL